jgi:hypothetical protein
MRTQDSLAAAIESTKVLMARYLKGFDDGNHLRQAPGLPNHAAWNLGHCALTMHRACELLDGKGPPETDFVLKVDRGDASRFGTESVAFGSTPVADAAAYPPFARCVEIYNAACDRVAALARNGDDALLQKAVPWGAAGQTLAAHLLLARLIFHNGFHTGQIADLRRATKMGSIFS